MPLKHRLLNLLRAPLAPEEQSLRQRRRLVKIAGLLLAAIFGVVFLGFVLFASPGRLSGGELGVLAAVGAVLFGSRLIGAAKRIGWFRWRR